MTSKNLVRITMGVLALAGIAGAQQDVSYDAYKSRVEPIFLKKREGHARCVVCHAGANNSFSLQALSPGAKSWTEEQSRKNFDTIYYLVVPGKPEESKLAMHPLAKEGGGDLFHSGGRQFLNKNDPDWKVIADWIRGGK